MCINEKMIPDETTPGMDMVRRDKGEWWRGKFKYDIFDTLKDFCKCHNVPPRSTIIKKRKTKQNKHAWKMGLESLMENIS
jgi:hypothetical protein